MNALQVHNVNLKYLTEKYRLLTPLQRIREFYAEFHADDVLVTSSFGASSAILLHHIAQVQQAQRVYFIDTRYLFDETYAYVGQLRESLGLDIVTITPEQWKHDFTKSDKTWEKDPDLCCSVNKVEPMDRLKAGYKLWVSGLMAYQTSFRKGLDLFEKDGDTIKFYPLIDVMPYFVRGYFDRHGLPQHPLVKQGYGSIGCRQCTSKSEDRSGRWSNSAKTECGLHLRK